MQLGYAKFMQHPSVRGSLCHRVGNLGVWKTWIGWMSFQTVHRLVMNSFLSLFRCDICCQSLSVISVFRHFASSFVVDTVLVVIYTVFQKNRTPVTFCYNFAKIALTPSTPAVPNCCCLGLALYWSNPLFWIFDIRALWYSVLSARTPECQKLQMVG